MCVGACVCGGRACVRDACVWEGRVWGHMWMESVGARAEQVLWVRFSKSVQSFLLEREKKGRWVTEGETGREGEKG